MGREHVCALTAGGALECWGHNEDGLAQSRPGPFAQLAASRFAYCAFDLAGRVSCWGYRLAGDDVGEWDTPGGVFTQVSVTEGLACGVREDTKVQCWGDIFEYHEDVRRARARGEVSGTDPVWARGRHWAWDLPPVGDGYASVYLEWRAGCGLRVDGSVWCLTADEDEQVELAAAGRYLDDSFQGVGSTSCGVRVPKLGV